MYLLPSASMTCAPSPWSTKNGCGRTARTGELTPPGRTESARSYNSREFASCMFRGFGLLREVDFCLGNSLRAPSRITTTVISRPCFGSFNDMVDAPQEPQENLDEE